MENSIAMNGGDGPTSYARNSQIQREGSDKAKDSLTTSIVSKLRTSGQRKNFNIADLGCSVGPNTFSSVKTIIEAVRLRSIPNFFEFLVFFNDGVANDFNTLFKNLPLDKDYMAAGVPGSFHGRLFPKSSIDFFHSAYALHWLSKVPDEVVEKGNKGRITYACSEDYVMEAYRDQFLKDMEIFFDARSTEMVDDGLMAVLLPGRPDETDPRESNVMHAFENVGLELNEMVTENLLDKALVDSFNLPMYIPTITEMKEAVLSNKNLIVEVTDVSYHPNRCGSLEEIKHTSLQTRAILEGVTSKHIGHHHMDVLFDKFTQKLVEFSKTARMMSNEKLELLFLLVRRRSRTVAE